MEMVIIAVCIVGLILMVCIQDIEYRKKYNSLDRIITNKGAEIKVLSKDLRYYKTRHREAEEKLTSIKEILGNA